MEEALVSSFGVRHLNPKGTLHRVSKAENESICEGSELGTPVLFARARFEH